MPISQILVSIQFQLIFDFDGVRASRTQAAKIALLKVPWPDYCIVQSVPSHPLKDVSPRSPFSPLDPSLLSHLPCHQSFLHYWVSKGPS